MAESDVKDKGSDEMPEQKPRREPSEAELRRELVEAVAAAYFGACRKLAKILNRRGR